MQSLWKYFSEIGVGQTAYLLANAVVLVFLVVDVTRYRIKRRCYCFACFREDSGWILFLSLSWFVWLVIAIIVLLVVSIDYVTSRSSRKPQSA